MFSILRNRTRTISGRLSVEQLEQRVALNSSSSGVFGPVIGPGDKPSATIASFVDPTALVTGNVRVGQRSYIAPFAVLNARSGRIAIGDESNVQDNVQMNPRGGRIELGDQAIVAHGASVVGVARRSTVIGKDVRPRQVLPSFVGFNSVIHGAVLEEGAMVQHLARVAPGVVIRSGFKVLPGKFVRTQAEADSKAGGKVATVTAADKEFMAGVIHVNEAFAEGYTRLFYMGGLHAVRGISANPGGDFNPEQALPRLDDEEVSDSHFANRIIGAVHMANTEDELRAVLSQMGSIRADEGHPFAFGLINKIGSQFTAHALEHSSIVVGNNFRAGFHALIHGGEDSRNSPRTQTRVGNNVVLGDHGVIFRSTIGNNVRIGKKAYVDGSQIAANTVIPAGAIIIDNVRVGTVEW